MEKSRIETLYQTIEEQNETINTYKTKLKDVVQAYKDQSKEKLALEASINILRVSIEKSTVVENGNSIGNLTETGENENNQIEKDSKQNEIIKDTNAEFSLDKKANIETLSKSLLTLMQQKTKLETNYLSEKKKYRLDLEELESKQNEERNNFLKQIQELHAENEKWRNKLRSQQMEHDKQQTDCAVMIRELQTLLNKERLNSDKLESQIENLQLEGEQNNMILKKEVEKLELEEQSLKQQLLSANKQLETIVASGSKESEVQLLRKQLNNLRASEMEKHRQDEKLIFDLKIQLSDSQKQSESRSCALEEQLCQLSESLGTYQKEAVKGEIKLNEFREKITQLEQENKTLLSLLYDKNKIPRESFGIEIIKENSEKLTNDEDMFLDILKMAGQLKEKGHKDFTLLLDIIYDESLHRKCEKQYEDLQDEFDKYKLRALSVLKSKSSKDSNEDQELSKLKIKIAEKEQNITNLQIKHDNELKNSKEKEEKFNSMINALTEKHNQEIFAVEKKFENQLRDAAVETKRLRERTVQLLAEKNQELEEIKANQNILRLSRKDYKENVMQNDPMDSTNNSEYFYRKSSTLKIEKENEINCGLYPLGNELPNYKNSSPNDNANMSIEKLDIEADDKHFNGNIDRERDLSTNEQLGLEDNFFVMSQLLEKKEGHHERHQIGLIHLAEEKGRQDAELSSLRKQKKELVNRFREEQRNNYEDIRLKKEELDKLREIIRKQDRDSSRESANLEYLKNVVFRYMTCRDTPSRQQIFNAISTILQFSIEEKNMVKEELKKLNWW